MPDFCGDVEGFAGASLLCLHSEGVTGRRPCCRDHSTSHSLVTAQIIRLGGVMDGGEGELLSTSATGHESRSGICQCVYIKFL